MRGFAFRAKKQTRGGAALVETAVCLPVWLLFLFGTMEFGHAYMVVNSLSSACRKAARYGVSEQITTAQVTAKVKELVGESIKTTNLTVYVKDAGVFDTSNVNPSNISYTTLPNIELSSAEPRQLFVVYASIPYNDVAVLPPFWITNATLKAQSVMRHE